VKWQDDCELASLPHDAAHIDAAMMFFHDTASEDGWIGRKGRDT